MSAQLYLWDDQFVWLGALFSGNVTSRHAVTLLMSLDGEPLCLTLDNGEELECQALLTAPRIKRTLHAIQRPFMSLNWDPHSFEFFALSHELAKQSGMIMLPDSLTEEYADSLLATMQTSPACGDMFRLTTTLFRAICPSHRNMPEADMRVLRAANRLRKELPRAVDADELAAEVCLSPDRLSHLFTEQLGMSMRNYLLWAKMRRAVGELLSGRSLTDIALNAGFADAAHFTRTLKEYYAVTPSFLADVANVTLHRC